MPGAMRVSVFITSYNQKNYLTEAVDSVLAQTRPPDELLILDDGSTDGSHELIAAYASQYPELIKPIIHAKNVGIPKNKNAGYFEATGDVVTYLDGDDRFLPNKLEIDLATLEENPGVDIAYSNFRYIAPDGTAMGVWAEHEGTALPEGDVFVEVFSRSFPTRVLFRNELVFTERVRAIGGMDAHFAMYHDWELRVRLAARSTVAANSAITSEYRCNPNGISRRSPEFHLDEMMRVFAKNRFLLKERNRGTYNQVKRELSEQTFGPLAATCLKNAIRHRQFRAAAIYYFHLLRFAPHSQHRRNVDTLLTGAAKSKLTRLAGLHVDSSTGSPRI